MNNLFMFRAMRIGKRFIDEHLGYRRAWSSFLAPKKKKPYLLPFPILLTNLLSYFCKFIQNF